MNTTGVIDLATLRPLPPPEPTPFELLAVAEQHAEADRIITTAQARAEDTIAAARAAEEAAGRRLDAARAEQDEAAKALDHTRKRATEILATNREITDGIRRQFDALLADAAAVAGQLTTRAHQLREEAADTNAKAAAALEAATAEAEHLVREGRTEAHRLVEQARMEAATVAHTEALARQREKTEAESDLEEKRKAALTEAEELRAAATAEAAAVRKAAKEEAADVTARARTLLEQAHEGHDKRMKAAESEAEKILNDARHKAEAALTDARRKTDAATTAAQTTRDEAVRTAEQVLAGAQAQAQEIRAAADDLMARAEKHSKWWAGVARKARAIRGWADRTFGKLLKTLAKICGLGIAAVGEYRLAMLAGFGPYLSVLIPAALDLYVISTYRNAKKDARGFQEKHVAVLLALFFNGIDRLAEQGVIALGADGHAPWWLLLAVSSIGPLVVWRVHELERDRHRTQADAAARPPVLSADEEPTTGTPAGGSTGEAPGGATGTTASTGTGNTAFASGGTTASTGTGDPASTGGGSASGNPRSTGTGKPGSTGGGNRTGNGGRHRSSTAGKATGSRRATAQQREAVRARVAEIIAAGGTPSPTALAAELGGEVDPEWVRNQIRAVRAA
ncbi:hypothetical protein ACMATS_37900 (plasmid) [Streptoverticillium reticulum]|uniref:hypothetical protein n=1 Tax=Streptoverticillium reticulum TaxID=1433415 RepID=UPI0039BF4082